MLKSYNNNNMCYYEMLNPKICNNSYHWYHNISKNTEGYNNVTHRLPQRERKLGIPELAVILMFLSGLAIFAIVA